MVTKEGVRFSLNRISGTFKLVVRNKMALVGLILLIGFVFAALGAPLLTPYGPNEKVAGALSSPASGLNYSPPHYLTNKAARPPSALIGPTPPHERTQPVAPPPTPLTTPH